MPVIYVEGKPQEVREGQNLLHALLEAGCDLPYFCWHPALGSVGSCRQCAVKQFKDEEDQRGTIVMACMTPVVDGMRISVDDPEAREFRQAVLEWVMLNHPHDCPICDEGGECHLQDMTVMTGHTHRRFRFKKRTFRNQELGPFIHQEMNRCIQCYRCVRFYHDYAGGGDLQPFGSRDTVFFGRFQDGVLESPFSGNLVEVCPTGVFTDKTFKRHHTRKWDLQTAPSVCVHCSLGCNTIAGERYGELRRILNRYHGQVNGYFLCDRGRFGYEFVSGARRLRTVRAGAAGSGTEPVTPEQALEQLAGILRENRRIIGIGSPRASLEANFALCNLVGAENFCNGLSGREGALVALILRILREGPVRTPSLREVEQADAVLILGEDITNTAPRLDLAVRQTVRRQPGALVASKRIPEWDDSFARIVERGRAGPLYVLTPAPTALDPLTRGHRQGAPEEIARIGFAIAHELDSSAPNAPGLSVEEAEFARAVAQDLADAERPLIISGTGCLSDAVLQAAANIAWALRKRNEHAGLSLVVPECNTLGVALMTDQTLGLALERIGDARADAVIVLENDLCRRIGKDAAQWLLQNSKHVIVIDHTQSEFSRRAEIILPASTFAETGGTLVNNEGRLQRFYPPCIPAAPIRAAWRWLAEAGTSAQLPAEAAAAAATAKTAASRVWDALEDVSAALAAMLPVFAPMAAAAPPADFRLRRQKIPRQSHRYSGRTSMRAHLGVSEGKPPEDRDSPLAFSMEGSTLQPPAALITRYWAPGWNSVQALGKFQEEIAGPLRGGDAGSRLIHPREDGNAEYYADVPAPITRAEGGWRVVPLYHVFGSEELSAGAPAVAELVPEPYVALNEEEATRLSIKPGDEVQIVPAQETTGPGDAWRVAAVIRPEVQAGTVGIPMGLPRFPDAAAIVSARTVRLAAAPAQTGEQ